LMFFCIMYKKIVYFINKKFIFHFMVFSNKCFASSSKWRCSIIEL